MTHGDFPVLLYTWMIAHADDDCSLPADPEELMYLVIPGRRDKTPENVADALAVLSAEDTRLLVKHADRIYFPPESFYRYQSYIPKERRIVLPHTDAQQRELPQIAAEERESAQRASLNDTIRYDKKLSYKNKTAPDPRIKLLIDYWAEKYLIVHNEKYHFAGGKDAMAVKRSLATFGDIDVVKAKIDEFFLQNDDFIQKTGHTLGVFITRINGLGKKKGGIDGNKVRPHTGKYHKFG
jgi:hypothetical protein